MSVIRPEGDGSSADKLIHQAEEHYQRAIDALTELIQKIHAGEIEDPGRAQRAADGYNKAIQTLLDATLRMQSRRKQEAGIVHDFALNLEDARNTIRGLLDRLRADGDTGEVFKSTRSERE
ncbi:MAG: hypothetical protein AAFR35_06050 [Pseudomonadota bacterium]